MYLSDLRTQVRNILNEATASFWSDAELNEWINWGIRELNSLIRIESNSTTSGNTVASTSTLNLAAGVARIVAVRLNSAPLTKTTISELVELNADLAATGTPTHYYLTRSTAGVLVVNWWPIPNAVYAYTLWTVNELANLVLDGDAPAMPARHHQKLVSKCLSIAFTKGGKDYAAATGWQGQWDRERMEIVADLMNDRDEGYTIRYVDTEPRSITATDNPLEWP